MKRLLVLGATGSIGTTCLNAFRSSLMGDTVIAGLIAFNDSAIYALGTEFSVPVFLSENKTEEDIRVFISSVSPDIALNGVSGIAGLRYSDLLIDMGIDIALANKESVVLGGRFLLGKAERMGISIIPVDSEHSAIWHLLKGHKAERFIITASGGPFRDRKDMSGITVDEALNHPTWKMGRKITIDSATLANKALEVIEASYLFSFPPENIAVTVHKESIIHSMIESPDGAVYALLSVPDMTLPIVSAITGEQSPAKLVRPLDFSSLSLTFEDWDRKRFPMLGLGYRALELGRSYPIAFAAADEKAVNAFLSGRIGFMDIPKVTEKVLDAGWDTEPSSLEIILEQTTEAGRKAEEAICSFT